MSQHAERRRLEDAIELHPETTAPKKGKLRLVKDSDIQRGQANTKQTKEDEFSTKVKDVLSRNREFTTLRHRADKIMDKLPAGPSKERLHGLVNEALVTNFAPEELWALKYELDRLRVRDYGVILDDALAAIDEEDQKAAKPIIAKKDGEVATFETKADFRKRIVVAKERVTELLRQVSSLTPTDRKKLRGLPEQLNKHLLVLDSLKSRPYNEESENLFKQTNAATDDFKVELNRRLLEITAASGSGEPKSRKPADKSRASERAGGQGAAAGGGEGGDDGGPPYDFITVPETGERIAIREIGENISVFAERLEVLKEKNAVNQKEYGYLKARLASARGEWEGPKGAGEQLRRIGRVDQSVPVVRRYGELMNGVKDAIETLEAKWLSQVTGGAGQSPESAADGEIANLRSRLEGIIEGLETFGIDLTPEKEEIGEAVFVKSREWLASLEQNLVERLDQTLEDEKEYALALQNDLDLARDQGKITDERHAEFSRLVKRQTDLFGLIKALRDANNYASFSRNISYYLRLRDALGRAFVQAKKDGQAEKKQERPKEQVDRLFGQIEEYYNRTLQPNFRQLHSLNSTAAQDLHGIRNDILSQITSASREILPKSVKDANDVDRLKDILEGLKKLDAVVLMRIKLTAPESFNKKPERARLEPSIVIEAGMPSATVDRSKLSRSEEEQDWDEFVGIWGNQVMDGQNVGNFVNRLVLSVGSEKGLEPSHVVRATERVMPKMPEVYATQDPLEAFNLLRKFISEAVSAVARELVNVDLRRELVLAVKSHSDEMRGIFLGEGNKGEVDLRNLLMQMMYRAYDNYYRNSPQDSGIDRAVDRIAGKLFNELNARATKVKLSWPVRLYYWNKYTKGYEAEREADERKYRRSKVIDDPSFVGHPSLLPDIIARELTGISASAEVRPEAMPSTAPLLKGVAPSPTKPPAEAKEEEKKKPTFITRLARWRKAVVAGALTALGIGGGAMVVHEMSKDEAGDDTGKVIRQERENIKKQNEEARQKMLVAAKKSGSNLAKPVVDSAGGLPLPSSFEFPSEEGEEVKLSPNVKSEKQSDKQPTGPNQAEAPASVDVTVHHHPIEPGDSFLGVINHWLSQGDLAQKILDSLLTSTDSEVQGWLADTAGWSQAERDAYLLTKWKLQQIENNGGNAKTKVLKTPVIRSGMSMDLDVNGGFYMVELFPDQNPGGEY